jgi:recombination protein RecA
MEEKLKVIKTIEAQLNSQFKVQNSIVRMGDKVYQDIPSIGGDLYTLDYGAIGTGGLPRGRIIELYGPESSGKTTICLHYVGKEQRRGGLCAYVDAEHAIDPTYAAKLGVDMDNLLMSQPDSGEQALETTEALVESRVVSLVVVDSVAALVPQAELDGEMGDSHMGLQARLMSQAMRKLRGKCSANGVTVIFINQLRENLGVRFGNPETTTGGRALKFYASLRIDVRKVFKENGGANIMSGNVIIGHQIRLKVVKNKVGKPHQSTEVDLIYGLGLDTKADMIEHGINVGAIQQAGAWFSFGEIKVQGKAALKALLRDDESKLETLRLEIEKAHAAQKEADKQ